MRQFALFLAGFAVLTAAMPAEARFGKRSSPGQQPPAPSQPNVEVHPTAPSSGSTGYVRTYRPRYHYRTRYFAPSYYAVGYAAAPVAAAPVAVAEAEEAPPQGGGIRLTTGLEAMGFKNGFTAGALIAVEGDRWGVAVSGQNIAVMADDGSRGMDHIQVATAHVTFAFLTGRYGRMRVELGADAAFAPNMISVGPTGGLSGVVYIGGPFAIEASAMVTPWPYQQLDTKLGLALGLGPVGLRAGARLQVLDDRGMVDGIIHRDVFFGPYVGASIVF